VFRRLKLDNSCSYRSAVREVHRTLHRVCLKSV
jgi:hypothetical protein